MMHEAMFYKKQEDGSIRCQLCPHSCRIVEGKKGLCLSRTNKNGKLFTENYGELIAMHIDPIEKKPLYHFYPSSEILSTGPNGCNFECKFCQNWQISNRKANSHYIDPEKLVEMAKNSLGIAYTYTEPTIWIEYIIDVATIAREKGLKNVMVTNGFIQEKPLEKILGLIDAFNIDLKSFDDGFYKRFCGGRRKPVMDSIKQVSGKAHLEVTNLVITGLNDSIDEFDKMVDFLSDVDENIPFHISKYYPSYEMNNEATSLETIEKFVNKAREGLNYVYAGNIHIKDGNNTICPKCGNLLISRNGYTAFVDGIIDGKCSKCGSNFDGEI